MSLGRHEHVRCLLLLAIGAHSQRPGEDFSARSGKARHSWHVMKTLLFVDCLACPLFIISTPAVWLHSTQNTSAS